MFTTLGLVNTAAAITWWYSTGQTYDFSTKENQSKTLAFMEMNAMWAPVLLMSGLAQLGVDVSLLAPYSEIISYAGLIAIPIITDWYYVGVSDDGAIDSSELSLLGAYFGLGMTSQMFAFNNFGLLKDWLSANSAADGDNLQRCREKPLGYSPCASWDWQCQEDEDAQIPYCE